MNEAGVTSSRGIARGKEYGSIATVADDKMIVRTTKLLYVHNV